MITPRLQCIIDHAAGEVISDIGTDHAYIPIELIETKVAKRVIASDIKEGPLNIARQNIKNHGMENKIEMRLGSGLSVLKNKEAETIIIAGMGGEMIELILKEHEEIAKNALLILQPMNSQYELRKYLIYNGYEITEEDIAVEGFKVYNVLIVKSGSMEKFRRDIEYHVPKYLIKHKYFKNLYEKKHREFVKVISGLENSKETDFEKLNRYKEWLKELEKYESD